MTTFYMVRHGEPDWFANEAYEFRGHGRDLVPLTHKGIVQAKHTATLLKDKKAELIIVSPYTRTMQTAAIISRKLDLDMVVEVDLREWQPDLTYEYRTFDEFLVLCKEFDEYNGEYPIGESKRWETQGALQDRVDNVLKKYLKYENVIVVAHEKVMRTQANNALIEHCELIEVNK